MSEQNIYNILGSGGLSPVGVTAANAQAAQEIVRLVFTNPTVITDCSTIIV